MIKGSLLPLYGTSSGCGWKNGLQVWWGGANILNKHGRTAGKE